MMAVPEVKLSLEEIDDLRRYRKLYAVTKDPFFQNGAKYFENGKKRPSPRRIKERQQLPVDRYSEHRVELHNEVMGLLDALLAKYKYMSEVARKLKLPLMSQTLNNIHSGRSKIAHVRTLKRILNAYKRQLGEPVK